MIRIHINADHVDLLDEDASRVMQVCNCDKHQISIFREIARACNCHDELVEALKGLTSCQNLSNPTLLGNAMISAHIALDKAKGEERG